MTLDYDATCRAESTWDVVVVGAGPAGSFLERQVARHGLRVLLVDRQTFPRYKVCGGCINLQALAVLDRAGMSAELAAVPHHELRALRIHQAARQLTAELPGTWAMARDVFDAALVDAARRAGVNCEFGTLAKIAPADSTASYRTVELQTAHGAHRTVAARVVVAAGGLSASSLLKPRELLLQTQPGSRVGVGAVIDDDSAAYAPGGLTMAIGSEIYVGVVRLADGRLNLAGAVNPQWLKQQGSALECVRSALQSAKLPLPNRLSSAAWQGTPSLSRACQRPIAHRLLAIGDAAGYIEPFTGEGIAWALQSAELTTETVVLGVQSWDGALERRWLQAVRREVFAHQWACRLLAALLCHPWAVGTSLTALSRSPRLTNSLVKRLTSARPRNAGGRS